jgi:hypothetical protein
MTDDKSKTLPITHNGGNLSFVICSGGCRIIIRALGEAIERRTCFNSEKFETSPA